VDTDQFIASLVSPLAWPAAVLLIALAFRKQIAELLTAGPLKRLKLGAVEAEFERRTAEIETKLEASPEPGEGSNAVHGATLSYELAPVADVSPSAAVLEAFARVQEVLQARLEAAGFSQADQRWGAVGLAQRAKAGGLITPQALEAVEGVAVMRNLAAHRPDEVSREAALEYLTLIDAVLFTLRSGGKN
jgi:hypothetical protein